MSFEDNITYKVSLWLDNDEDTYEMMIDFAVELKDRYRTGAAIREYVEDIAYELVGEKAGLVQEVLFTAIAYVDWERLADTYVEVAEEVESQEVTK